MNKRNTFFKQVDRFINEYSIGQIILAADYNDILSKIDTKILYQSKKFDKPVHNLKSMIKSHKLIDIWRQTKKIKTRFTWNRKDKSEATRIDYFLVSTEILMNSYSSDIRSIALKFTDHTSISLHISLFLKLTVHSTYTEKLQINEQIKLYTIYTNTVNRQMELAYKI